jgi:hypothetical protein
MRFNGLKKSIFIETVDRGQYWFFISTKIIKTNDAIALLHNWQVRLPPILPEGDFPGEKPQETEDKGSGLSKKTYQLCYYVMILNTKVW